MNLCPPKLPVRDPSSVPFTHRPNSSARSRLRVDAGVAPYFLESCVSVSRDVTLAVTACLGQLRSPQSPHLSASGRRVLRVTRCPSSGFALGRSIRNALWVFARGGPDLQHIGQSGEAPGTKERAGKRRASDGGVCFLSWQRQSACGLHRGPGRGWGSQSAEALFRGQTHGFIMANPSLHHHSLYWEQHSGATKPSSGCAQPPASLQRPRLFARRFT